MKIVHSIPHISVEASGPSYSVPRLCMGLDALGHDVSIMCLAARRQLNGVKLDVYPSWPILQGFSVSHRHTLAMAKASAEMDVIHNHSLWSMTNISNGFVVPGKKAKLVTSPRGTLSEWALTHSKGKKKLLWPLQKRLLQLSDLIHATSEDEYKDVRRLGFEQPVLIAPNGIDLPEPVDRKIRRSRRTLLFLSRIHPVKGLELLIDAWCQLESSYTDWQLKIVGPGDSEYLASLLDRVSLAGAERVEFIGPLYGLAKAEVFCQSDLFVLPTHSENFGMVVAEALSHGCPVVVSKGAPWSGVELNGCGWWVENNVSSFCEALARGMSMPETQLNAMGRKGRDWMSRDFSWDAISATFANSYSWLLNAGEKPESILLN